MCRGLAITRTHSHQRSVIHCLQEDFSSWAIQTDLVGLRAAAPATLDARRASPFPYKWAAAVRADGKKLGERVLSTRPALASYATNSLGSFGFVSALPGDVRVHSITPGLYRLPLLGLLAQLSFGLAIQPIVVTFIF